MDLSTLEWIKMSSTTIEEVCWKPYGNGSESGDLIIKFKSGKIYRYPGVYEDDWYDLQDAESKGRFFNDYIKGEYTAEEVVPEKPKETKTYKARAKGDYQKDFDDIGIDPSEFFAVGG